MSGSSLNKIMGMGNESLFNARAGVDVTGHNISNAHTEGYSRQVVQTSARAPLTYGRFIMGSGAELDSVKRAHDEYVERQMRSEMQNNGHYSSLTEGLRNLEDIFSPELTSTIRERADSFINSVREFSNYPEEIPVRVSVVDNAAQLAESFNTAHSSVREVQENLTSEIYQHMNVANNDMKEIAWLNVEIMSAEVGGRNPANDLLDRRDDLIRKLGEKMDISVYKDRGNKVIIRGPSDTLLVEDGLAAQLEFRTEEDNKGLAAICLSDLKGQNYTRINDKFTRGKIGGLVQARDVYAQRVRDQLNDFAREFAVGFNRVHRQGYGISQYGDVNGRDFFADAEYAGEPAEQIKVSTTLLKEPESIGAALSPFSPGDNIIANEMVRFFDSSSFAGGKMSFRARYEDIVGHIGTDVQQATDEKDASDIVLAQIRENKEAVSGVSLDEEATNMMKYQNIFNASSKLITTADEMMQTVLDLKR